jgi:hypothetical protein
MIIHQNRHVTNEILLVRFSTGRSFGPLLLGRIDGIMPLRLSARGCCDLDTGFQRLLFVVMRSNGWESRSHPAPASLGSDRLR